MNEYQVRKSVGMGKIKYVKRVERSWWSLGPYQAFQGELSLTFLYCGPALSLLFQKYISHAKPGILI